MATYARWQVQATSNVLPSYSLNQKKESSAGKIKGQIHNITTNGSGSDDVAYFSQECFGSNPNVTTLTLFSEFEHGQTYLRLLRIGHKQVSA
jgi:hypothetical protein